MEKEINTAVEAQPCFHCSTPAITEEKTTFDDKVFCCEGCKSVYQILTTENLEEYYLLNQKAGIKPASLNNGQYDFLKNEAIEEKLLWFKNDSIKKLNFFIPAIHCASCIWLLENLTKIYPTVIESRVNFTEKRVSITLPKEESLFDLVNFLHNLGYSPNLNFDETKESTKKPKVNRSLILKIGVAGFCFGNIMLLSFPEYIPGKEGLTEDWKQFFGYLNFTLALPVLFFSATPYLRSAYTVIKHKALNMDVPIALGIFALFIRSSYEIFSGTGAGFMDSFAALIFFLLIGKWFQEKTYRGLSFERDYQSYFPIAVTKINGLSREITPIENLKAHDIIEVRNGELIPADAILLSNTAQLDYSFITGESEPTTLSAQDKIYAGAKVIGASVTLKILTETNQSRLTKLWNQQLNEEGKLTQLADKVGRNFTFVVLTISFFTALAWYLIDPTKIWFTVSAVLIIACPCALALSIPFGFGNAMRLLGRKGLFLKSTDVIEKLAETDTLVFDKTGTLTSTQNAQVTANNSISEEQRMVIAAVLAQSIHPLSRVLHQHVNPENELLPKPEKFEEIKGKGLLATYQGQTVLIGSAKFLNLTAEPKTLTSQVYVSINGEHTVRYTIKKDYRVGLSETLAKLKPNFNLFMLSGDNDSEREALEGAFGSAEILHFNQTPEDKKDFVEQLNKKGNKTAMIGDGLNDAAALKVSNLGIAVADDLFQFSPASKAILNSKNFTRLPDFFRFGKNTLTVIKWSFVISFSYNIIGLSFAVQGLLTPVVAAILMPISSITVVGFVTLGTWFHYLKIK
ncbi:MAG: heavy metal translocating P-type ATPase [Luteibaculaceae bacterium]